MNFLPSIKERAQRRHYANFSKLTQVVSPLDSGIHISLAYQNVSANDMISIPSSFPSNSRII
jgi:hypothetical protein